MKHRLLGVTVTLLLVLAACSAFGQTVPWEIRYLGNVAPDAWGSCGVSFDTVSMTSMVSMNWNLLTGNSALGTVVDDSADPDPAKNAIDGKAYKVSDSSDADNLIWRSEPSLNIDGPAGATILARVKTTSDSVLNPGGNIGMQGSGLASAYHWGGPNGDIVEPFRGGSTVVPGDGKYHILRLAAFGNTNSRPVPFIDNFTYADGALDGNGEWSGAADGTILAVDTNTVKMTAWLTSDVAIQNKGVTADVAILAGAGDLIILKAKIKRGTQAGPLTGGNMWDIAAYDTNGALMAWWYGTYRTARPRSTLPPVVLTPVAFDEIPAVFHDLECRINTATKSTEYLFDGVSQGSLPFPYTKLQMAAVTLNAKSAAGAVLCTPPDTPGSCIGDTLFFDDMEITGTAVPGNWRTVNLYLDENPVPKVQILDAASIDGDYTGGTTDRFRMGAFDLVGTQDVYFDWVVGTGMGAFAPGQEVGMIGSSLAIDPVVATTIAGAKMAPERGQVELAEVAVGTLSKVSDPILGFAVGGFTVEELNRSAGIRVIYNPNPDTGAGDYIPIPLSTHVKLSGTCQTINGERVIVANHAEEVPTMDNALMPLDINNRMSGGGPFGQQPGLVGKASQITGLPAYSEPFTYSNGLLVGNGLWNGTSAPGIEVSGNQLVISSTVGLDPVTAYQTRTLGDCGTGQVSVKIKVKTGTDVNNFWTLTVADTAGVTFGYWMGSGSFVRGRMPNGTDYTAQQSLTGGWDTLEIKANPAANTTEFWFNGAQLGATYTHTAGDEIGRISIDRVVGGAGTINLDNLEVSPASAVDVGLNSVGLYGTIHGRVTNVVLDTGDLLKSYFYIDDGSGLSDGSGNVGIKCTALQGDFYEGTVPALNSYVSVTGTMSVARIGGNYVRLFNSWMNNAY